MLFRTIARFGVFMILLALPALAAWEGEEVVRDGVTHFLNPETAVESIEVDLEEVWRVGGYDDEEVLFGVISKLIEVESGDVFLLDGQLSEIHVYSPDGEYQRTIGREGEGPGEFRGSYDMFIGFGETVGVLQIFPGKIVQLTTAGDPAGNFPLPEPEGGGFQLVFVGNALEDRLLLAGARMQQAEGKQVQITYLKSFDADGNELAHFAERSRETQYGGMKFVEQSFSGFERRWGLSTDGRVAASLDFDDYRIHVWNSDGELLYVIAREGYELMPRTEAEKNRFHRMYTGITRWNPGSTFEVSETHMTVNQVAYRNDGSLWVLSSRGMYDRADGVFASLDVYDPEGHYVRRVDLKGEGDPNEDAIFFGKDRIYVVTDLLSAFMAQLGGDEAEEAEEEPEPVSVIAYRMGQEKIASR